MGKSRKQVYYSIDVETDGPIPGYRANNMLSLGCVAFDEDGEELGRVQINFERDVGTWEDETKIFWENHLEAYQKTREDLYNCNHGIAKFIVWAEQFKGERVCVAYPAGFDFTFLYWYLSKFGGEQGRRLFSFSCLDIKTLAMVALGVPYREASKRNFKSKWVEGLPTHSHVAVEDAYEQGVIFFRIKKELGI